LSNAVDRYLLGGAVSRARRGEELAQGQKSFEIKARVAVKKGWEWQVAWAAEVLQDLRIPPSSRLKKLSGDRKGQYRFRINDQWRIFFEWRNGDAVDVEIVDYH
jgi:proteic killer suppression protein